MFKKLNNVTYEYVGGEIEIPDNITENKDVLLPFKFESLVNTHIGLTLVNKAVKEKIVKHLEPIVVTYGNKKVNIFKTKSGITYNII